MKTAVFTIASKNYFAQVKTLMNSLKNYQPSWDRYVVLVDACAKDEVAFIEEKDLYTLIAAEALPIDDVYKMFFRYTILELNTAVKPWGFEKLMYQDGYDAVVYMDPDICVYRDMHEIDQFMQTPGAIVLTPHIMSPLNDEKKPTELNIMQGGIYNLGFIAVSKGEQTPGYIQWWENKLEYECVVDLPRGLFVDQKWMDFVPSLFDNVIIFKHCGYNAAYWNLSTRKCTYRNEKYYFNEDELVFFHYSGFDPLNLKPFSKHQNRFTIDTVGEVKRLAQGYAEQIIKFDYVNIRKLPYAYNVFNDGTVIIDIMRKMYNNSHDLKKACGDNPFINSQKFNYFIDTKKKIILSGIMDEIWKNRVDLQAAFPGYQAEHNLAYALWFIESTKAEYHLDEKYITPVKEHVTALSKLLDNDQPQKEDAMPVASVPTVQKPSPIRIFLIKMAIRCKPFFARICPAPFKERLKAKYVSFLKRTYND